MTMKIKNTIIFILFGLFNVVTVHCQIIQLHLVDEENSTLTNELKKWKNKFLKIINFCFKHFKSYTYSSILGFVIGSLLTRIYSEIISSASSLSKEVYEYSQIIKSELSSVKRKFPHVHHIAPAGDFSGRSIYVQNQVAAIHQVMKDAGINRWTDPMNLMLVSAGTHASLHTDVYINHVYSYIIPAAGDKNAIYAALFALRIEIAAIDMLASGY